MAVRENTAAPASTRNGSLPELEPPIAEDEEKGLIGAILIRPDAIAIVRGRIVPEQLFYEKHRKILRAAIAIDDRGETVQTLSVAHELIRTGDLDSVGGTPELSELLDWGAPYASQPHVFFPRILEAHGRRLAIKQAEIQTEDARLGITSVAALATTTARHAEELQQVGSTTAPIAQTTSQIMACTVEAPRRLLANGVLCAKDLMLLAGKPGLGKTRLLIELSFALASGAPWVETYDTDPSRPARVGYLAAELDEPHLKARLSKLIPADLIEAAGDRVVFVHRDLLPGSINLLTDEGIAWLQGFCRAYSLEVLILDALSRLMGGQPEDNEHFGVLRSNLDRLRFSSGAAIIINHHERKSGPDVKREDIDRSDAIRGGSILTDGVNTTAIVERIGRDRNLRRLVWVKANFAAEPAPLSHRIPDDGGPTEIAEGPEEFADNNQEQVYRTLAADPSRWWSRSEISASTGLGASTSASHLRKLHDAGRITRRGAGRTVVYRVKSRESAESSESSDLIQDDTVSKGDTTW
jgi:replicative DNA helicase